jgi:hypothetical protein
MKIVPNISIIASVPPAILMVIGLILIVMGKNSGDTRLSDFGFLCIILGVSLQVLWLFTRRRF